MRVVHSVVIREKPPSKRPRKQSSAMQYLSQTPAMEMEQFY